MISERLFAFFGSGFNDTAGVFWCGEDWFVSLGRVLAIFFGSSSYLLLTFKGPILAIHYFIKHSYVEIYFDYRKLLSHKFHEST